MARGEHSEGEHVQPEMPPVIASLRQARALRAERKYAAALALIEARLNEYPRSLRLEVERIDLLLRHGRILRAARLLLPFARRLMTRAGFGAGEARDREERRARMREEKQRDRKERLARMREEKQRDREERLARMREERQRDREERRAELQEEKRRAREEREALLDEARRLVQQKDLLRARAVVEKLRESDPLDSAGRIGLVRLLRQFGLREQIEEELADYARLLTDHPRRDALLARVAATGRLVEQATAHYEEALRKTPKDAWTWREAGVFYFREGLVSRALHALETAVALDPEDEIAGTNLEKIRVVLRLCGKSLEESSDHWRLPDLLLDRLCETAPPPQANAVAGRVVHVFASFGPGGVQRQLLNLVRRMRSHTPRLEQMVLLPMSDDDSYRFHRDTFAETGADIAPALPDQITPAQLDGQLTSEQIELLGHLPKRLGREIACLLLQFRHYQPEVVHAWVENIYVPAGVAAALAGVPRVVLAARSSAPRGRRQSADYMYAAHKALLARENVVLTSLSTSCVEDFQEWLAVPDTRLVRIYNGCDVDGLLAQRDLAETHRLRTALCIPECAPVIGSAYRMNQEKRPLLWVEAAAKVAQARPDVHFVLLGDGVLLEAVKEKAEQYGLKGRFHLPGLAQNVTVWFDMFDVVLLTSRYEGTTNVLMEAQALGRPVVAPHVGGISEAFVPGETGLLLAPDPTADEIAIALLALLDDPQKRKDLAPAAEAFIRSRYSMDRVVTENVRVYGWPLT